MLNFVTQLKFTLTKDRLPEDTDDYFCLTSYGHIITLKFNNMHDMFNVSDDDTSTAIVPLAWAPIPRRVKEYVKKMDGDDNECDS